MLEQLLVQTVSTDLSNLQLVRLPVLESRRTLSCNGRRVIIVDISSWMSIPRRFRLGSTVRIKHLIFRLPSLTTASGSPSVSSRNSWDIPLANFTVVSGENHLQRPVAGGRAESGALRYGEVKHTNLTLDTQTGEWKEIGFDTMYVKHED